MEFLTVKETAQLLRVSPITVRRYIASGKLAAERVGRGIRVRREAIEEFVTPVVSQSVAQGPADWSQRPANYADEDLVEIAGPNGVLWAPIERLDEYEEGRGLKDDDPLLNIIGVARSGEPTNNAEHKHECIAAFLASSSNEEESEPDALLGKPFTMNDALWSIFGIGESDDPTDVSENKHEYLAEAYLSDKG